MTIETPVRPGEDTIASPETEPVSATTLEAPPAPLETAPPSPSERPDPNLVALSSFLALAAVAWMFAGVFSGSFARMVGLLAAAVGVGLVALSYRMARPAFLQYAVPLVGAGVGAMLALAAGGQGSLPTQIVDAVRAGGISHPPIPFDPGWRFVLVVIIATLGGASTTLAISLNKPKLAILVPAPLVFLGALVQPPSATVVSSVVALVLFIGAFGASYGVELAREGANSRTFEGRRVLRAAGLLAALAAALVLLSESGFLLPKNTSHAVIPPQFPQPPPPPPHGVLFTATMPQAVPIRLGVLDVYRKDAWLTPPFDPSRFQTLKADAAVQTGHDSGDSPAPTTPATAASNLHVHFTVHNLGGHVLPDVASPIALPHQGFKLQYDPRTQSLRLPNEVAPDGLTYTEIAPAIATAKQLEAGGPVPKALKEYLQTPPAPPAVQALLAKAPTANTFVRLQYVRTVFYQHVIASGTGNPVPMPASRVAELLSGKPGTPFEIVAAESLLARWAGVPSRIGYGYYKKTPDQPNSTIYSISSVDGAVWLEAYFNNVGWVPIVGTPPKAQANLDRHPKKPNPTIKRSDRLSLQVFVPVKQTTSEQLYQIVRYWLVRFLPLVLGLSLLLLFYPGPVKIARQWRRRRWAGELGPREVVAAAYAELRDGATDLNIGSPAQTPLEFLGVLDDDAEHRELAWLVTRLLWADLSRDARLGDAELAADMAASVLRRLRQASPAINRIIAFGSRASLRDPFSREIPSLWPSWSPRRRIVTAVRGTLSGPRRLVRGLRAVPRAAIALVAALGLSGCGAGTPAAPVHLPARLAPATLGALTFNEEHAAETAFARAGSQSLVGTGVVYSIKRGGVVLGDLQVAAFRPPYSSRIKAVKKGVLDNIGANNFQLSRIGDKLVYDAQLEDQQLLMWFSPDGRYYDLVNAETSFTDAENVFLALLNYQQGGAAVATTGVAPIDPRRGDDYSQEGSS